MENDPSPNSQICENALVEPIKIHCFTGAINFMQFYSGQTWPESTQTSISSLNNQYKTYLGACCNKNTWLKILNSAYCEFVTNNKENAGLWDIIKSKTGTEKLMFLNDSKEILTV